MAITYNAGTNTITVTGYTEGTPCNCTDVYNADVAGAWGVFSRQGLNQFFSTAYLNVGDGSTTTWFADTYKQIGFDDGLFSAAWLHAIRVYNNATFRFGELMNATKKTTGKGCALYIEEPAVYRDIAVIRADSSATLLLYDSFINGGTDNAANRTVGGYYPVTDYGATVKIYNCIFNNAFPGWLSDGNLDLFNLTVEHSVNGCLGIAGSIDRFTMNRSKERYLHVRSAGSTIKNAYGRDGEGVGLYAGLTTTNCYVVNADLDLWTITWNPSPYPTIYRQYEFDLKVIDKDNTAINGATVKIWDKNSNLIVDTTTNASGVIATQTITRGTYTQATGNTLQEKSPHLIKIEKAGYTTYEADFTLDDKMDWLIALQVGGGGLLRNPPMTGGMV
jgi:hypothetical protein